MKSNRHAVSVLPRISRIVVACYRGDFYLTRLCVASIRYWHPEVPITLLKDYTLGAFDTSEIEALWNCQSVTLDRKKFGWSFIKLEPFFWPKGERIFVIDSDIVFVGPVLDALNSYTQDFVVHGSSRAEPDIRSHYYHEAEIQKILDPAFRYPGYIFNCGHIVANTGVLSREDFNPLVDWSAETPRLRHPRIFSHADQGIMNYVLHAKSQRGELSVASHPFSIWGPSDETLGLDFSAIARRDPSTPKLIHYAGPKSPNFNRMPRPDILYFFEKLYYRRVQAGALRRVWRSLLRRSTEQALGLSRTLLPATLRQRVKGWI